MFLHYARVICSHGYLFEGGEQLDADKPKLIASDMFKQECIVLQVLVRQVVLNLSHQFLDELWIWGLPALLLHLPSTGACTAVCGKTTWIMSRDFSRTGRKKKRKRKAECFIL